jgi:hypothetical protein
MVKDAKTSLAEAPGRQRTYVDRIYRTIRIFVFQNMKTQHLVDPVDPV